MTILLRGPVSCMRYAIILRVSVSSGTQFNLTPIPPFLFVLEQDIGLLRVYIENHFKTDHIQFLFQLMSMLTAE